MIWKERKLGVLENHRKTLKHIQSETYECEKYEAQKKWFFNDFQKMKQIKTEDECYSSPGPCLKAAMFYYYEVELNENTIDLFFMFISGFLWALNNGGIPDNDPSDFAFNTWFVINEFATGEFDDLFTPEDLVFIKKDLETVFAYYDEHPALKGWI